MLSVPRLQTRLAQGETCRATPRVTQRSGVSQGREVIGGSNHELTVAWFPMLLAMLALIVFERSFE
jgi:hypothetical protein